MWRSNGFSLVELLVTVAIVVLVTAVVVPNFGGFRQRQTLERTADEVRTTVLQAQAFALAPRRVDSNLVAYSFAFSQPTSRYSVAKVLASPRSTVTNLTADPNLIERQSLPSGITFGTPSFNANASGIHQVDFLIGSRAAAEAVTRAGAITSGIITVPLIKGSAVKTVRIQLDTGSVTID